MQREIHLSGSEITLLKAIGLTGASIHGRLLIDHVSEVEPAEFLDELRGLITQGYVLSDKHSLHTMEDVERAVFRVNSSYVHDLREAIHPSRGREQHRRRRRRG
jgi:hypothetical protein